jgi:hypothetical protein
MITNATSNTSAIVKLIKVESKNPKKVPKAAFNARLQSELSWYISPAKAPIKGPNIKLKGKGKMIPMISPTYDPLTPNLVPLNTLVPYAGMVYSSIKLAMASNPKGIKTQKLKSMAEVQ